MSRLVTTLTAFGPENRLLVIGETDEQVLRQLSDARAVRCTNPACGSVMLYRHGAINAAHFAHWTDAACSDPYGEPDGLEHRAMKWAVLRWLRARLLPQWPDVAVGMEGSIVETGQRADVLATWPDGRRLAIEVQVSPLTGAAWTERHRLYRSANIAAIWLLHPRRFDRFARFDSRPADMYAAELGARWSDLRLNDLLVTMARAGYPLMSLDADTDVGAMVGIHALHDLAGVGADDVRPLVSARRWRVPLDACRLRPGRLVWPPLEPLLRAYAEQEARKAPLQAAERAERDRQVHRAAQAEQGRQRRLHAQIAAARALLAGLLEARAASLVAKDAQTGQHPVWALLVRRYGIDPDPQRLSPIIGVDIPAATGLSVGPRLWQTVIVRFFVWHPPDGVTSAAVVADLRRHLDPDLAHPSVVRHATQQFLRYLMQIGHIAQRDGRWHHVSSPAGCPCPFRCAAVQEHWQARIATSLVEQVRQSYPSLTRDDVLAPRSTHTIRCAGQDSCTFRLR